MTELLNLVNIRQYYATTDKVNVVNKLDVVIEKLLDEIIEKSNSPIVDDKPISSWTPIS